ncbi:MAG: phosphoribosylanthranilate isomerase [Deltaproteobacteria bacterium]|nr:phosphoribosylanthranilate isomerase [Deltaproteobacteria bacterium]MBW2135613.1 phosphoribosylanthranilate isomerase [Deltaproteobacteria bacterium]
MVRVKICGLTNLADAQLACELGAQALGFIFYPKSPRYVAPDTARQIISQLPPLVLSVGVFVDEELAAVRELAAQIGLDWLQLHGEEPPDYCQALGRNIIKVIPVKDETSLELMAAYQGRVRAFLLDTYKSGQKGGTGQTFDWPLARRAKAWGPVILAGGLNPENVAAAVRAVQPQAVDVASGVEATPGRKDPEKLKAFFKALNNKFIKA